MSQKSVNQTNRILNWLAFETIPVANYITLQLQSVPRILFYPNLVFVILGRF